MVVEVLVNQKPVDALKTVIHSNGVSVYLPLHLDCRNVTLFDRSTILWSKWVATALHLSKCAISIAVTLRKRQSKLKSLFSSPASFSMTLDRIVPLQSRYPSDCCCICRPHRQVTVRLPFRGSPLQSRPQSSCSLNPVLLRSLRTIPFACFALVLSQAPAQHQEQLATSLVSTIAALLPSITCTAKPLTAPPSSPSTPVSAADLQSLLSYQPPPSLDLHPLHWSRIMSNDSIDWLLQLLSSQPALFSGQDLTAWREQLALRQQLLQNSVMQGDLTLEHYCQQLRSQIDSAMQLCKDVILHRKQIELFLSVAPSLGDQTESVARHLNLPAGDIASCRAEIARLGHAALLTRQRADVLRSELASADQVE